MLLEEVMADTMMAIIATWPEDGSCVQDNNLRYLLLLLFKVALNILILAFCVQHLRWSFMWFSGLSLCLADTLLLCGVANVWLSRRDAPTDVSDPMCLLLTHSSTIYAMLPLPVLVLGALDHALHLRPGTQYTQGFRAPACCVLVLLIWLLAALHSYYHTYAVVVEVKDKERLVALLCVVRSSFVVVAFCMVLFVAVVCVLLLLSCHRMALWMSPKSRFPDSQLEDGKQPVEDEVEEAVTYGLVGQSAQPGFLRFALGFALNWTPFLILNIACVLLGFAIPSYIMVNLLWVLCADSLIVGTVFWCKGGQPGDISKLLNDMHMDAYRQLGAGSQGMAHRNIYTML